MALSWFRGRRPSKTRGFLRFSSCPCDPLRTLGWSTFENSWFLAIFKSPARPSASQWDLLQGVWRELENVAEPLELLLKRFSFFENSCFSFDFQFARATLCGVWAGRPSKTRGFFCDFQIARAVFLRFSNCSRDPLRSFAWSNRSRCGAALILMKLRDLNRCQASGVCTNAN